MVATNYYSETPVNISCQFSNFREMKYIMY